MTHAAIGVVRINLLRALNVCIAPESEIVFRIILTTEFQEKVPNIIQQCAFVIRITGENYLCDDYIVSGSNATEEGLLVRLKAPEKVGRYQLMVESCNESEHDILPLLTEYFSVVDKNKSSYGKLLSVYRPLCYHESRYLIKESFGETLGSHIWDCAIVTLRQFHALLELIPDNAEVVELGCGCGLTGIALANSGKCSKVWLTDKAYQLPYIETNIALNNATTATAYSLDWEDDKEIDKMKQMLSRSGADVIIAADVLYDAKAVTLLFNVIEQLSLPTTTIIIAQKIRGHDPKGSVDVSQLRNYKHAVIATEANVIIHRLSTA